MARNTWRVSLALLAAVAGMAAARAQTPIPPAPADFLAAAAESDAYETMAATDALTQSKDPRIHAFAQQMIDDHARLGRELRDAAVRAGLPPPPPAMSADQARLLSGLQGVRGAEFDKTYAGQQVLAHTQALAVEESFAASGDDANLQQAAKSAVPTIRDHLDKARQLREAISTP